jgi:hypothetical protein
MTLLDIDFPQEFAACCMILAVQALTPIPPALTPHMTAAPCFPQLVDVDAEALVYACQGLAAFDASDQPLGSSIQEYTDSYEDDSSGLSFDGGPDKPGKARGKSKQKGSNKFDHAGVQQDDTVIDGSATDERTAAYAAAATAGSTFSGATTATATSVGHATAAAGLVVPTTLLPTDPDSVVTLTPEAVFALSSRPWAVKKVRPAQQQHSYQQLPYDSVRKFVCSVRCTQS